MIRLFARWWWDFVILIASLALLALPLTARYFWLFGPDWIRPMDGEPVNGGFPFGSTVFLAGIGILAVLAIALAKRSDT